VDKSAFDRLTCTLTEGRTRRGLLALLAGGLAILPLPDEAAAERPSDRIQRRSGQRNRKQRNKRQSNKKNNTKGKGKGKGKGNGGGLGAADCTVCASGCAFSSVQAAIDAATAGGTITVCPGAYNENLTIPTNLTLAGAGDGVILDGNKKGSVVIVQDDVTATIQGVTIVNGTDAPPDSIGGGITVLGDLTLTNAIVENNTAATGGGIAVGSNRRLTLNNTIVRQNSATSDDANPDRVGGGAIWNGGQVTIENGSVLTGNQAFYGGAIANQAGVVTISGGSRVTNNQASHGGGGIYNDFSGQLTIDGSTVASNTTQGQGGGILNLARKGNATLTIRNNAEIGQNSAQSGGGVANQLSPSGGAAAMTVSDSAITNNSASQLGGGIYNVGSTVSLQTNTVFENSATVTGGGIFNTDGGVVSLDNQSAVVENTPNNCVGTNACGA
jgi:hypothetical protein